MSTPNERRRDIGLRKTRSWSIRLTGRSTRVLDPQRLEP